MIRYRGFKAGIKKFYMPTKPIRAGFKLYALAESSSGYMINFICHPHGGPQPVKMSAIAMQTAEPILDQWHHIFTDRLYTSVALTRLLLARDTYLTGTVKSNSKGLPVELLNNPARNPHNYKTIRNMVKPKAPRGIFYIRQNGQLTCAIWKDSKAVMLLSSAHQPYRRDTDMVTRKIKDDGMGTREAVEIAAPPQAKAYTKNMGGVDRSDQLRSYYTCSRKSQLWWKKVLYFLLDITQVNAWICYKHHQEAMAARMAAELAAKKQQEGDDDDDGNNDDDDKYHQQLQGDGSSKRKKKKKKVAGMKMPVHRSFVCHVANGLIGGFAEGTIHPPQPPSRPVQLANASIHYPAKMNLKSARQCKWCLETKQLNESGNKRFTRWGCPGCGTHLHQGHCFNSYHAADGIGIANADADDKEVDADNGSHYSDYVGPNSGSDDDGNISDEGSDSDDDDGSSSYDDGDGDDSDEDSDDE
jgi:hypothetical protein